MVYIWGMNARLAVPVAARALAVGFALLGASAALAQTPSFTLMGLTGSSRLYGLSADGQAAAGYSGRAGVVWSASAGRYDFGYEAGLPFYTQAWALSGDGHTAVGWSGESIVPSQNAFRWSGPGTYQTLGSVPGYDASIATGVNNDGSIIIGNLSHSGSGSAAFRWTQAGGMQPLGAEGTRANAISRDGSVVVGETDVGSGAPLAVRWTQAGGMQLLQSVGGSSSSYARGINVDGSYIVGNSVVGTSDIATVWHNGVPALLDTPSAWLAVSAQGVSDDGQVVIGTYAAAGLVQAAAVWTPVTGFLPLADYLTANGVALPSGVTLSTCTAVSADGTTFVGWTGGPAGVSQGFVATVPAPATCVVVLLSAAPLARRKR